MFQLSIRVLFKCKLVWALAGVTLELLQFGISLTDHNSSLGTKGMRSQFLGGSGLYSVWL